MNFGRLILVLPFLVFSVSSVHSETILGNPPSVSFPVVDGADKYRLSLHYDFPGSELVDSILLEGNAYQFQELNPLRSYKWRVRARVNGTWESFSTWEYFKFETSESKASAPTLITPSHNSVSEEGMSWSEESTATRYHLQIYDIGLDHMSLNLEYVNSSSIDYTGVLIDGHSYRWRVRVANNAGYGDFSSWNRFVFKEEVEQPLPIQVSPAGELASVSNPFQWEQYEGANLYSFIVRDESVGEVVYCKLTSELSENVDYAFEAGKQYRWLLRAKTEFGWTKSARSDFHIPVLPPLAEAPVITSSEEQLKTYPLGLSWELIDGVDKYRVVLKDLSDNSNLYVNELSGNSVQTEIQNIDESHAYRWIVRGRNNAGLGKPAFADVRFDSTEIVPSRPALVSPAGVLANEILSDFVWDEMASINDYQFQLFKGSELIHSEIVSTPALTHQITLEDGVEYKWRIRARNNGGFGKFSAFTNFKYQASTSSGIEIKYPASVDYPVTSVYGELSEALEGAVYVNGKLACRSGKEFYINNIALGGSLRNTIKVTVLSGTGEVITSKEKVFNQIYNGSNSESRAVVAAIDKDCGMAELDTKVTMDSISLATEGESTSSTSVRWVSLDYDGDDEYERSFAPNSVVNFSDYTYTTSGVYEIRYALMQNVDMPVTEQKLFVLVTDETEVLNSIGATWASFLSGIQANQPEQYRVAILPASQEKIIPYIEALSETGFRQEVAKWSGLTPAGILYPFAEFVVATENNGDVSAFTVNFVRDESGKWLIREM